MVVLEMETLVLVVKRISVMVQLALSVQILLLQIVGMDRVWLQEFKSLDCSLLQHRLT